MAHTYSEFDTTPGASGATVLAAIKSAILASSDYSNPSGSVVQATAASGATICMDLVGGGSPDNQRLRPKAFRGAGATLESVQRSLYWNGNGNVSNAVLHCRVAAGPTLLYIEVEGPRSNETGTDNVSYGSLRQSVWIADLTPYMAADTTPCVVFGGSSSSPGNETANATANVSDIVNISRNQAGTSAWAQGRLYTMMRPAYYASHGYLAYNPYASDGTTFLWPYVVIEDSAGPRGRLTDVFSAGTYGIPVSENIANIAPNQDVTYGGKTYRTVAAYKSDASRYVAGSFGFPGNSQGGYQNTTPVIAVRKA